MKAEYINDSRVATFLSKALMKVGALATYAADRRFASCDTIDLEILLEYIECLADDHTPWPLSEVHADIDFFNSRFDLNTLPLVEILQEETHVLGAGIGAIGSSYDIVDFAQRVQGLFRASSHNSLAGLQGGTETERYHLGQLEHQQVRWILDNFDALKALLYKAPTLRLLISNTVPLAPNGVFEVGTSLTQLQLTPEVAVNGGGSVLSAVYFAGPTEVKRLEGIAAIEAYLHKAPITATTLFKVILTFAKGEVVQATNSAIFVKPYFHGKAGKAANPATIAWTKEVKPDTKQVDVVFTFVEGNASESNPAPQVPYLKYPKSKGLVKHIYSNGNVMFDYLDGFKTSEITHTHADGTQEPYYLLEKIDAVDGTMTINFIW